MAGFQPVMWPVVEAKRKMDRALAAPDDTTKSVGPAVLNTWPVGAPPGSVTVSGAFRNGLPPTSPVYRAATPVPLAETQNAPVVGLREMPQPLTSSGSWISAAPAWSDTRLVCRNRPS